MSQFERFAAMFAAIDDDGRRYVLAVLRDELERVQQRRRPILHLIQGGAQLATEPNSIHTLARIKNRGQQ